MGWIILILCAIVSIIFFWKRMAQKRVEMKTLKVVKAPDSVSISLGLKDFKDGHMISLHIDDSEIKYYRNGELVENIVGNWLDL